MDFIFSHTSFLLHIPLFVKTDLLVFVFLAGLRSELLLVITILAVLLLVWIHFRALFSLTCFSNNPQFDFS